MGLTAEGAQIASRAAGFTVGVGRRSATLGSHPAFPRAEARG